MSDLKFLLDENIPWEIKEFLESKLFKTEYATKGIVNSELISHAVDTESALVTRDKDFLNAALFPPREYFGIIVFKVHPPTADKLVKALDIFLEKVENFKGKTFVIEEEGFKEIEL